MRRAPFVGRIELTGVMPTKAWGAAMQRVCSSLRAFRSHRLRLAYAALERRRARGES